MILLDIVLSGENQNGTESADCTEKHEKGQLSGYLMNQR